MQIIYEDKIVAFIDVLGFSNLVYSDKIEPISHYYEMILTDFKKAASKNELKFLMISDSIVVHAPSEKRELLVVLKVLNDLQHRLLLKGILIRGGISYGKLYVNDAENIIVGTGLINAYKLEGKAVYPRIIIDRNFIPLYWTGSSDFFKHSLRLVKMTPPSPYIEDFPYIDIGRSIAFDFQPIKFKGVIQTIKENYYNNDHITKYEWLRSNIIAGVKPSLEYLKSKTVKTKNELRRIKLLTEFLDEFENVSSPKNSTERK